MLSRYSTMPEKRESRVYTTRTQILLLIAIAVNIVIIVEALRMLLTP